jgi:hypothetical protein
MKYKINYSVLLVVIFILQGCSLAKLQKRGSVETESSQQLLKFATAKGLILVPATIDGVEKNYIFDTGADLSLFQSDSLIGKLSKISGASNREMEIGYSQIPSFKIESFSFKNIVVWVGNLQGLKNKIDNFGGIIGQNIINKANWLIDYPQKELMVSNENLVDSTFRSINVKRKGGAPYTFIQIDGKRYRAILDLGSRSVLNIPQDSKLAKRILMKYKFKVRNRERFTIGGMQTIREKIGVIPWVKLGDIRFDSIETTINRSSQLRIGVRFFENCVLSIDNLEKDYKVKIQE